MTELKQFTRAQISETDRKLTRIIIHDKVYDVTQFLNEHPGGEEVLLDHKGVDASEDFDDVGHSADAQELMKKYMIGELVKEERTNSAPKKGWTTGQKNKTKQEVEGPPLLFYMITGGFLSFLIAAWYFQLGE